MLLKNSTDLVCTILGVGFASKDNVALTTLADVRAVEEPIAISIDGKAVREIPGPAGLPYIGNYFEVYPDHLGNHQRLFEQYGPLIKTTNLGSVVYHTNDPVLASIFFSESDFFTKVSTACCSFLDRVSWSRRTKDICANHEYHLEHHSWPPTASHQEPGIWCFPW
jgi:hypothetical protein